MKIWKSFTIVLLLGFTLLYLPGVSSAQDKEAEVTYQVIRLLSNKIVPSITTIKLGTVVIWVNEDSKPTEIRFANVNDMVITCEGAKNSVADPEKIISQMIPCAGVESLCLIQKGEFKYVVKRGFWEFEGTIIVE
jgi:plastocyanin